MTRSMSIVTILALFGSLFLASLAPAAAQDPPVAGGGVTVTGYGMASGPAESVQLEFLISDQDTLYGGPPLGPQVEATPGAEARETVGAIEAAIAAYEGVESVEVVVPLFSELFGPASVARIMVTVVAPDRDGLTGLVTAVVQAAAADRLLISYVGAMFETSDCATLEGDARQAAFEDARGQAEVQATALGVTLGAVAGSSDVEASSIDFGSLGVVGSNCDAVGSASSLGQFSPGATLPRFDPTADSGEVEVYRQVRVTFAIDGAEATPAV